MKLILSFVALFFFCSLFAQEDSTWKEFKKELQREAYHDLRLTSTVPPYGLAKIKGLIKKIKSDDEGNAALSRKVYDALSLREKFTYNMIHAESYSQNCDMMPLVEDEQKKIFGYLPDVFDEFAWSDRQTKFLHNNRDSVIALMKESITRTKKVGVNFKEAIIEINAKEMLPILVTTYNVTKKDHDILTLLMLLMKDNKYEPFLTSMSYKKLYGDEDNYQSFLIYSKANEDLIIKRATEFYNGSRN
jgi:hypothetical protein